MTDKLDVLNPNPYMPFPYGGVHMGVPLIDIMRKNKWSRKYLMEVRDTTRNTHLADSIHKAIILFVNERQEERIHGKRHPGKDQEKAIA